MKEIETFMHCRECVVKGTKPQLEVGLTKRGIQVWCKRHDREVGSFSPVELQRLLDHPPGCECCQVRAGWS